MIDAKDTSLLCADADSELGNKKPRQAEYAC
jgi:hypothetical protein